MKEAIWQEVECGGYTADLEIWDQLANSVAPDDHAADVLDVGCGNGRVSVYLAERAHRVTGLDASDDLLAELDRRARRKNVDVRRVSSDARDFALPEQFDLVLAPMQLVQLLGGADRRAGFLRSGRAALRPGGRLAVALMDLSGESTDGRYEPALPDVLEVGGAVYSSLPVAIRTLDRGREIALDRLRTTVAPDGQIVKEHNTVKLRMVAPERLEREAVRQGLEPAGRIAIGPTDDHVGSIVTVFRRC